MLKARISVVAAALGADVRDAAEAARRGGFAGVVLEAYSAALNIPELSASGRRELRLLLESQQQPLIALRCDLDATGLRPRADVQRILAGLDRVLEAARALAGGCVLVDLGPLPAAPQIQPPQPKITAEQAGLIIIPSSVTDAPAEQPPPPAPPQDPQFEASVQSALAALGESADRYSVKLALSSSLAGFAELSHALRSAACPWFGVDLDAASVPRDRWDIDAIFSSIGSSIVHVRARDAALGADGRAKPAIVGQGNVDWRALIAALDHAGYAGHVTVDPMELSDRVAAARAGRGFLARL